MTRLRIVTVKLPNHMVRAMDELVKDGVFANRSEIIRYAIQKYVIEKFMYIQGDITISRKSAKVLNVSDFDKSLKTQTKK